MDILKFSNEVANIALDAFIDKNKDMSDISKDISLILKGKGYKELISISELFDMYLTTRKNEIREIVESILDLGALQFKEEIRVRFYDDSYKDVSKLAIDITMSELRTALHNLFRETMIDISNTNKISIICEFDGYRAILNDAQLAMPYDMTNDGIASMGQYLIKLNKERRLSIE